MKFNTNFFNKKISFIYLFILLIFIKLFSFYSIQENRELPIEPDDAYFYYAQAILSYEDNLRESPTLKSLKDIVFTTYENEKSDIQEDVSEIGTIERIFTPQYFLYSKILGFFAKYLDIDKVKLWWIFNYITQILILTSSLTLVQIYLKNENYYQKSIIIFYSFFLLLSIKHHISETPLTLGSSLFLISIYFVKSKNSIIKYICYFLNFISLHFHPGVFLISCIFLGTYFTLFIFFKKKIYLNIFLGFALPILFALILERFFYLIGYNSYLGLFENTYTSQTFAKMNSLIDIFNFNYSSTVKSFYAMISPLIPFMFKKKIFIWFIYFFSILIVYKKNKELFFLNCFSFILILLGCFYFISMKHPGNLIYYTAQGFLPIIMLTIFNMYFFLNEKINEKLNLKKPIFLTLIVLIIFYSNISTYLRIIEKRTDRQNYENIENEIIKFKNDVIENKNEAIIIGDKIVLFMFLANINDTNIYLDDKYRLNNKSWVVRKDYKIKGYIGRTDGKKVIDKDIFVMKKKYRFNKQKEFKNFYFLYN